jgi:class 3 adenylate cyclase
MDQGHARVRIKRLRAGRRRGVEYPAMLRLSYLSQRAPGVDAAAVRALAQQARAANSEAGITSLLICTGAMFFQVLEGDDGMVEWLYDRIRRDPRHHEVVCLRAERGALARLFPGTPLILADHEEGTDVAALPLRTLLATLSASYQVLERYTQQHVLHAIRDGQDPLAIPVREVDRVILFADIVGFTALAESCQGSETIQVVNHFLDLASHAIDTHGGTVSKYIGDALMAYFPGDEGPAAIEAGLDLLAEARDWRHIAQVGSPLRLLHAGVGIARGRVLEGNIGSALKLDYTVIGDAVNAAARLEGLTRILGHRLLFTPEVYAGGRSWPLVHLGCQRVKGRSAAVEALSLDHPLVREPLPDSTAHPSETTLKAVRPGDVRLPPDATVELRGRGG